MLREVRTVSFALLLALLPSASAGPITGTSGLEGLGQFSGTFTYSAADANNATLQVFLENTSAPANGGYITAFVFNNPGNRIATASLDTNLNFGILGTAPYNNGVGGTPFGQFDIGASLDDSFLGGVSPNGGIGVGASSLFTFTFTGNGLDLLDEDAFFAELSVPPGDGEGPEAFVVRFRGFANGGSDKVPGTPDGNTTDVLAPEPSSLALAGIGLGCLIVGRIRSRRRRKLGAA